MDLCFVSRYLIFLLIFCLALMSLCCLVVDTDQGVYPGLQKLEDALFLLIGFAVLHGDDLFLLGGIHQGDLLTGGHRIQSEDPDPARITDLLLLYDAEFILHTTAVHLLIVDVEHPLL